MRTIRAFNGFMFGLVCIAALAWLINGGHL